MLSKLCQYYVLVSVPAQKEYAIIVKPLPLFSPLSTLSCLCVQNDLQCGVSHG